MDVKRLDEREIYANPFMKVVERRYEHCGKDYRYYVKEEPDFAICGAITEDGDILMVRQFRPGPDRYVYDMPGGMIDEGQTPLETVRKELMEETGYAGDFTELTTTYVTAYSTARKHIYLAKNCRKVQPPEEDPNMVAEPVLLSGAEFAKLLASGELVDLDCALLLGEYLRAQSG